MKINSIIDLVKDLDTSRQTKNLNKLLIRILLHLQVEFSIGIAMNILLVSNSDICRSRMAQKILSSFGYGTKIFTSGVLPGRVVPSSVVGVMEQNGYDCSRKKASDVDIYCHQPWDYVITLCEEAKEVEGDFNKEVKNWKHFSFDDPFQHIYEDETELEHRISELYETMYRELYEFYRDELSEQLLPRCTCGANTYCRCE